MKNKTLLLTLFSLLAATLAFTPALALSEPGDNRSRDRQKQESRSEHRETRQINKAQRVERNAQQRIERRTPQHIERNTQQRMERRTPQRVERNTHQSTPQRLERQERREHRPAVVQPRSYEQRRALTPAARRHIETRRSLHIKRPARIVKPRYYRHVPRSRYYMGMRIYRPYGYLYPGFGHYYSDHDAFRWLAFTALTLSIIDHLDEHQQRMHEQALIRATTAQVGDTLYWDDRHASGSVTILYIGTDHRGREYREFRQTVTARGRTETSYGSAYLKANGSWKVSRMN